MSLSKPTFNAPIVLITYYNHLPTAIKDLSDDNNKF